MHLPNRPRFTFAIVNDLLKSGGFLEAIWCFISFQQCRHARAVSMPVEGSHPGRGRVQAEREDVRQQTSELARCQAEEEEAVLAVEAELAAIERRIAQQPMDKAEAGLHLARRCCPAPAPSIVLQPAWPACACQEG